MKNKVHIWVVHVLHPYYMVYFINKKILTTCTFFKNVSAQGMHTSILYYIMCTHTYTYMKLHMKLHMYQGSYAYCTVLRYLFLYFVFLQIILTASPFPLHPRNMYFHHHRALSFCILRLQLLTTVTHQLL